MFKSSESIEQCVHFTRSPVGRQTRHMNLSRASKLYCLLLIVGLSCGASGGTLSKQAQSVIDRVFGDDTAATHLMWQDSSFSRYTVLREAQVLENHTYLDGGFVFGSGGGRRIISQHIEWVTGPWEIPDVLLEASAILISENGSTSELWSIVEAADEGKVLGWDDLYETTTYGCCEICTVIRLHSLKTGKVVLTYTHNLIGLNVDDPTDNQNTLSRFIGSIEPWHATMNFSADSTIVASISSASDSMTIALISYASEDSCLHTLALRARTDAAYRHSGGGLRHCNVKIQDLDTALANASLRPGTWFFTSTVGPQKNSDIKKCVMVSFEQHEPVFIIPLQGDDFLVNTTTSGDYEFVRVK